MSARCPPQSAGDCVELLLNHAEDGEETGETERVCRKSRALALQTQPFSQNRVLFSPSTAEQRQTLPSVISCHRTASQRLLSQTLRRSRRLGRERVATGRYFVQSPSSSPRSSFPSFPHERHAADFGETIRNYSDWTILSEHQPLRRLKQGGKEIGFRTRVLFDTLLFIFFCFVSFNWPDPCCLVMANVTFD